MFNRWILAVAALTLTGAAQAVTVPGLYNTGAGVTAGQVDAHYTITTFTSSGSSFIGTDTAAYRAADSGFPMNVWTANTATSAWIIPTSVPAANSFDNAVNGGPSGVYDFKTTFNFTGFDLAKSSIVANVAADNQVQVYLNGTLVGSINNNSFSFSQMTLNQASGLVSGSNTLLFRVTNAGSTFASSQNPFGLNVNYDTAQVTAVPEPSTYALMLGGLMTVGFMARRRRSD